LTHPDFCIAFIYYWTCYRPENMWNTACNNHSISKHPVDCLQLNLIKLRAKICAIKSIDKNCHNSLRIQYASSFSKSSKKVFDMQGAWHFPNMLPTMVHDQAFPIRTCLLILTTANFGGFSNFCRYYTRSQAGKSTRYRPTLKTLPGLYIRFHPVYQPCFYFTRKQMTPFYWQQKLPDNRFKNGFKNNLMYKEIFN
jgi:hypothetical protein